MTTSQRSARRSDAEQKKFNDAMVELWEQRITFNQLLRLKVLSLNPADVQMRLDMRPELVGHYQYGRLHGGVIASVLDALGGSALMVAMVDKHPGDPVEQAMGRFYRLGTIDLRVDYLRPGLGRYFMASSEITRLGGRVGSTQTRLHNDEGVLIATAAAAYIVS